MEEEYAKRALLEQAVRFMKDLRDVSGASRAILKMSPGKILTATELDLMRRGRPS